MAPWTLNRTILELTSFSYRFMLRPPLHYHSEQVFAFSKSRFEELELLLLRAVHLPDGHLPQEGLDQCLHLSSSGHLLAPLLPPGLELMLLLALEWVREEGTVYLGHGPEAHMGHTLLPQ
jgi:hypothetical protein